MEQPIGATLHSSAAPSLSIVTVVYQNPDGLDKTLHSLRCLLEDRELTFEIVLVDASVDAHADVLAKHAALPIKHHIEQSPQGIYKAMNTALEQCQYAILWFLNGSDLLASNAALKNMLMRMNGLSSKTILCADTVLTRNEKLLCVQHAPRSLDEGILGFNRVCHQAVLFSRQLFADLGPYSLDYQIASDYEYLFRIFTHGGRLEPHREVLASHALGGRSDVDQITAISEFRAVQKAFRKRLPATLRGRNLIIWVFHAIRLNTLRELKALASFLGYRRKSTLGE